MRIFITHDDNPGVEADWFVTHTAFVDKLLEDNRLVVELEVEPLAGMASLISVRGGNPR